MKTVEEKEVLWSLVCSELKNLGLRFPKKIKPNAVKQEKIQSNKVFGVDLSDQQWVTESGYRVPRFIVEATEYLRNFMKNEIGLFRKAGSITRQRELRVKFENGKGLENAEPNDVASLLKQWLRELPNPLVPSYLHDLFLKCQTLEVEENRVPAILLACLLLPDLHLYTLKHLLNFLSNIAENSEWNKMVPSNLAIVMAPNLFPSEKPEKSSGEMIRSYNSVVEILIVNASKVGEAPTNIAAQLALRFQKEKDVSLDVLECTPAKRRRRSGGVADLVNGIRKLVGNNSTPMNFSNLEDFPKGKKESHSKSASKRKAEPDVMTLSEAKLTATMKSVSKDLDASSFITPNSKKFRNFNVFATPNSTTPNTPGSHKCRKSFGLLRKRNRKKEKAKAMKNERSRFDNLGENKTDSSCHNRDDLEHIAFSAQNFKNSPRGIERLVTQEIVPYVSSPYTTVDRQTKLALPEIQITVNNELTSKSPSEELEDNVNIQGSSEFPNKENILEPEKGNAYEQHKLLKNVNSSKIKHSKPINSNARNFNRNASEQDLYSFKRVASIRRSARRHTNVDQSLKVPTRSETTKESRSDRNRKSKSPTGAVHSQTSNSSKENSQTKLSAKNCLNNKSAKSLKSLEDSCKNPISISKTPVGNARKPQSNKSSLRRGRPNTVTSGLKSELCPKYYTDSNSSSVFHDHSISKSNKSESVTLDDSKQVNEFFFNYEDSVFGNDPSLSMHRNNDLNQSHGELHLPLNNSWMSNSSQSLNGMLNISFEGRDSSPHMEQRNFSNLLDQCLAASPSNSNYSKMTLRKRKSSTNVSILTPSQNNAEMEQNSFEKEVSPQAASCTGKEVWISGKQFLNTTFMPEENSSCKRESIIHLIANNAGKVQANVQHFNFMNIHKSLDVSQSLTACTSNPSVNLTPEQNVKDCYIAAQSGRKILVAHRPQLRSRSTRNGTNLTQSEPRVISKNTRFNRSPIPLPPKFVVDDSFTKSPLKEVTNTSNLREHSFNGKHLNSTVSPSPKHTRLTVEDLLDVPSKKVAGRYSDGATRKRSGPSRSESSPAISITRRSQQQKKDAPFIKIKGHHSFNSDICDVENLEIDF